MSYYGNNNQSGGYGHQGGGYGGPGGPQGGYGGHNQGPGGEANSYYNEQQGQQHQQQGFGYGQGPNHQQNNFSSPPPYQNQGGYNDHNRNDGPGGYGGPGGPGGQEGEDGERGLTGALAGGAAGAFGGHKVGGNFGHSKTSTFIGAVAGAFAGHKLQDGVSDWKHERDDKKEEEKRREEEEKRRHEEEERRRREDHHRPEEHQHHHERRGSGDRPRGGNFAGGFTGSSRDIRIDAHGDYNLRASCKRRDGGWQESCISLNRYLENDQGSFRWTSGGGGGGGEQNYTVQQGDTLRNIGDRFGASWEEIARHNNIANPDQIWPGQNLRIPGRGGGGGGGNFGASARDVRLVDGGQRLEAELSRHGQWVRASINLDEKIGNNDGTLHYV